MDYTEYNFLIVLFKNKKKRKIINKFKTLKKAKKYFDSLINESKDVVFCKEYENGSPCNYELALLEKGSKSKSNYFIRDEIGRQVKIELEDSDFVINKIESYCVPDSILDYQTKKKIQVNDLIEKYIPKDSLSMISKLNNKIVIQNDDNFYLFTLKNSDDANRLIDNMNDLVNSKKRINVILVKDYSTTQRKYLYSILEEKGFPKSYLFRHSTTHQVKR
jgi:hypothetical protein